MTATGAIPISVVVMTRNEAANIAACLASLRAFAEIVVVDSASDDGTALVADSMGARTVRFAWNGRYPKKKQWCLDRLELAHRLVLFVDADERVTPELAAELARVAAQPGEIAAWFVPSRMVVLGRALRFGTPYRKIALMRRDRVRFPDCPDADPATACEVEGHYQPVVDGRLGRLRGALLHHDLKPPSHWLDRHNRYSDWEAGIVPAANAAILAGETGRRRLAKRVFQALPCRPVLVFLYDYLIRLGCLDGRAGYHHAAARAFYYWQIEWKRAWMQAEREPGRDPQPITLPRRRPRPAP